MERRPKDGNIVESSRAERAAEFFGQGYNCCQSVFLAFCDKYGIEQETALRLSCSFGGGMGRMRQVCGAVSGMALVCGLETGNTDCRNQQAKTENYETMRRLAEAFRRENGSIVCGELLGLTDAEKKAETSAPSYRTAEYYKKRPCKELVRCAAEILEKEFY
ncbi:C-GCAxxG-C-C family protein [Qiania dongpingensis]|uniref:C_GCAxxG_C_C family protein n=1 Tax=Qiania dongpingensis TaxID=2763669 RepID=A0A7G9G5P3_9FIRM|nr:C-GCAxxG-C-C family protein [Qiania dongpingensis]QNM06125.1 C_GCAxxG_C_C family protein [Qiania dongpingensis]